MGPSFVEESLERPPSVSVSANYPRSRHLPGNEVNVSASVQEYLL